VWWLKLRHWDLQLLERCQTDEVKRCATISKDVVQLNVGDGEGDEQRELPVTCHILGAVKGIKANRRLYPLVVRHRLWCRGGRRYLPAQGFDDAQEVMSQEPPNMT
jgi:hypothetical protein